jgi:hypothetical protein
VILSEKIVVLRISFVIERCKCLFLSSSDVFVISEYSSLLDLLCLYCL